LIDLSGKYGLLTIEKERIMKKSLIIAIAFILTAGMLFSVIGTTLAVVGPVHVEMNISGERLGPSRANTVTAFKIYMRLNVNIEVHDWIKMWFPIDEASCDPADICGNGFVIKGQKESPRFVPNDAYFKKYNNEEEEKVGKIYEILDEHEVNTRFGECTKCEEPEDNCRIVEDPSGLGCWLMGTVLPCIPRDQSARKERTAQIIHTTSIGYSPCSECQGFPILIQNCKERSYQVNSPVGVEAWRQGYNPIDINTSKATGIIVPATPGRYRLRIATRGEPTPVESDSFVLPCSQIENLTAVLNPPDLGSKSNLVFDFDVGEGGALDAGNSLIMFQFPKEFKLPRKIKPRYIKVNGIPLKTNPQVSLQTNKITIVSSSNVDNTEHVTIEFDEKAGIVNPSKSGIFTFSIYTSTEPETISCDAFAGTKPSVTVTPPFAGTPATWSAVGLIKEDSKAKSGSNIVIVFPKGTVVPKTIDAKTIKLNKKDYSGSILASGSELTLKAPEEIEGALRIFIDESAGILNPPAGDYELKFMVSDKMHVFEKFTIQPSIARVINLSLTETQGYEPTEYKFTYIPSIKGGLSAGDTITVEFPESTVIPKTIDVSKLTVVGKAVKDIKIDGYKITFTVEVEVPAITGAEIIFTEDSGILTPQKAGTHKLFVTSSKDAVAQSPGFGITQPKLITEIKFKDPNEPDGCNGWYKTPPILSLVCRNPDAKIYLWYDLDGEDKHILYSGEKRLSPGSMRPIIHYQAVFGDEKEEPKEIQLFLDTIPPSFEVKEPSSSSIVTRDDKFVIKGERYFIEMLTDGGPSHQVADGVLIKVNDGEYIQLIEPEIFAVKEREAIESEWELEVDLNEGTNTITILGRDQACNEDARVFTIIRDNTPPEINIITPKDGDIFEPYEIVTVEVETESKASVFINGSIASVVKETANGKSIFAADVDLEDVDLKIIVEAKDTAGNSAKKEITISAVEPVKTIRLKLWVNTAKFVKDNKDAPKLDPMPTTQSPPLPPDLVGNTYMPVRAVFEALGATVGWDGDERRVDVRLGDTFLQLWIDNPKAKINGVDTPIVGADGSSLYPAIVADRTMLPLRFACESLGAEVGWNAEEKAVTVIYPKP
jgi:Copper amine oxidase N-terminal domain